MTHTLQTILTLSDNAIRKANTTGRPPLDLTTPIPDSPYAAAYTRFLAGTIRTPPPPRVGRLTAKQARQQRREVRRLLRESLTIDPITEPTPTDKAYTPLEIGVVTDALHALIREQQRVAADALAKIDETRRLCKRLGVPTEVLDR